MPSGLKKSRQSLLLGLPAYFLAFTYSLNHISLASTLMGCTAPCAALPRPLDQSSILTWWRPPPWWWAPAFLPLCPTPPPGWPRAAVKAATSCWWPLSPPHFPPWCPPLQLLLFAVSNHFFLLAIAFLLADVLPLAEAPAIAASVKNWHENMTEAPFGCRGPYQLKLTPLCIDRCHSSVIISCKQQ